MPQNDELKRTGSQNSGKTREKVKTEIRSKLSEHLQDLKEDIKPVFVQLLRSIG